MRIKPRINANTKELLALGVFGPRSRLGERVARLLQLGREFSPRVSRARVAVTGAALLWCAGAASIAPRMIALAEDNLRFAVSSIRPAEPQPPGEQSVGIFPGPGGGLRAKEVSLLFLIGYAYFGEGPRAPTLGGPGWASKDEYDVTAAPEPGEKPPTQDQIREMTRNMLADRFKLALHRETREMAVYALTVGKNGAKLQREQAQPSTDPPGGYCDIRRKPECTWTREKGSIADLMALLGQLGRPLVDRTGLGGEYDIRLKYSIPYIGPEQPDDPGRISLRDAVQDQLGLRIEDTKAPVEVLVIDRAEKPEEN